MLHSLSVVIPCYNQAKYLNKCLNSVLNQYDDLEKIICIDDGSTDESFNIMNSFAKNCENMLVIQNNINIGIIPTLNMALKICNTEYIFFLGADDWILPNFIKESMNMLHTNPNAGLCSAYSFEFLEEIEIMRLMFTPSPIRKPGFINPIQAGLYLHKYDSWFMGNTVIFKTVAAREFDGFNIELQSFCDNFLCRQVSLKYGACFIPKPMSVWRRYSGSFSNRNNSNLLDMTKIYNAVKKNMLNRYSSLFSKDMFNRWKKRWSYTFLQQCRDFINIDLKLMECNIYKIEIYFLNMMCSKNKFFNELMKIYLLCRLRPFDIMDVLYRRLYQKLVWHIFFKKYYDDIQVVNNEIK